MKIGLFTDCYFPNIGGAEIVVHQLATVFCRLGHETVVMAPKRKGVYQNKVRYKLVTYPSLTAKLGLKTFGDAAALLAFQKRFNFDIINIHKTYTGYSAGKIKRYIKVPVVITAHGGDIQKHSGLNYGRRLRGPDWEKKIAYAVQKADALIAISSESADCFRDLGASESQIHRIPNGVDIERFNDKVGLDRNALGLKQKDRIVLAVGRYHIKKGYETLIRSMAFLKKRAENVKLLIVGDGMEKLNPLVCKLGVGDRITFIQQQDGKSNGQGLTFPNDFLLSLYKGADIFISSSIIEGFALVCIEAMAAGLPMVLARCPGNEDVLQKNGWGGYYVEVGDAEALADKIALLLGDKEKRIRFSAHNKKVAEQKYSLGVVAKQYLNLFAKIANC